MSWSLISVQTLETVFTFSPPPILEFSFVEVLFASFLSSSSSSDVNLQLYKGDQQPQNTQPAKLTISVISERLPVIVKNTTAVAGRRLSSGYLFNPFVIGSSRLSTGSFLQDSIAI